MLDTAKCYGLRDRDGVINRRIVNGYVARWKDFAFLPKVFAALRLFTNRASGLLEAAHLIVRRDTPTLEETLRRRRPHFHSAWHAAGQFSNPAKRNHA